MNVWELQTDSNRYASLNMVNRPRDWDSPIYRLRGEPLLESWVPLQVCLVVYEDERFGDFTSLLTDSVVYTERAFTIIQPLLEGFVELLPLECRDCSVGNPYVLHATTMLNCLDHERSEFQCFSDGRVMYIKRYVFKESAIREVPIFKIPEQRSRTYITDSFKRLIEDNGLTGLSFISLTGQT